MAQVLSVPSLGWLVSSCTLWLVGCAVPVPPPSPTPAPAVPPAAPATAQVPLQALARQLDVPAGTPQSHVPQALYDLASTAGEGRLPWEQAGDGAPTPVWERGGASWYGMQFHMRKTASGERFDMGALTAAHKTLPFGTRVCVRSLVNGREVLVRINDRGPFAPGRVIDLSRAAAEALGMVGLGIKQVSLSLMEGGDDRCAGEWVAAEPGAVPVAGPGATPKPKAARKSKARR